MLALLMSPCGVFAAPSFNFKTETKRATSALKCSHPMIAPAVEGEGALYSCVAGQNETVKFFINENETKDHIENIKITWNDETRDTGNGVHTDKKQAQAFVTAFSQLYAPMLQNKLLTAFFSNTSARFSTADNFIDYTFTRDANIDERVLLLTPKPLKSVQEKPIPTNLNEFNVCKNMVSKAAGYSSSYLTEAGEPIQESSYKSYMLAGKDKDFFFCEIHSAQHQYKIKAALKGKLPFTYIAEGKL